MTDPIGGLGSGGRDWKAACLVHNQWRQGLAQTQTEAEWDLK